MTKSRILILDDEDEVLDVLEEIFSPTYFISRTTRTKDAISILSSETIQLIISDVIMPEINGFEFCRLVKSHAEHSHIPIVLLTAKDALQSKIDGLEIGADAYIEKPFSKKYLIAQINNLITNRKLIKHSFIRNPLLHIKSLTVSETDGRFIQKVNDIINVNLNGPHLNVDFIANALNMSRMTLYRKIVTTADLTPSELINLARLKKAIVLMTENKYKLFEIALMIGYSDHSSFTRSFQNQYGLSPREYIKKIKEAI